MLKAMFKPFFKRFVGLFISMSFVSLLAITLLVTFGSSLTALKNSYSDYLTNHENVDELVSVRYTDRENMVNIASKIEGVDKINPRLSLDIFLKKDDDSTIMSRVFTYNEEKDPIFKRYISSSIEPTTSEEKFNISVSEKFATNNNFKLGDTIKLGYLNYYIDFYVYEIVDTPEGITPRVNDYVWSDSYNFGYLYISENELARGLDVYTRDLRELYNTDPEFKQAYDELLQELREAGYDVPDILHYEPSKFVSMYANQLLIKNKEGVDAKVVAEALQNALIDAGINVNGVSTSETLPYRAYMDNAMRQLTIASLFLPIFFYAITMIVVGLFINQIIKTMTPQIGVMMSIGVGKKDIVSIFVVFTLLMSFVASILGVAGGYGMSFILIGTMRKVYSMPFIPVGISVGWCAIAIGALFFFVELTTLISCKAIFKITPKDATISNESKRKQLPKWLDKFINRSPMNVKLATNSIAQNPKRFFVSTFAMFASIVLILLSGFFFVAKNEMINQSVKERLKYDAQTYFATQKDDEFLQELKNQSSIVGVEDCLYTYVQAYSPDKSKFSYLECLGISENAGEMIYIPPLHGKDGLHVLSEGLILNKTDADKLGVKKGDTIIIDNQNVTVTDISYQYFHPITYMSKKQLNDISLKAVSSYLIDLVDTKEAKNEFMDYLSEKDPKSITVYTSNLGQDLYDIFNTIDIFIIILILFSIGISFVILSIMSQNALLEQQRQLSVFRTIGFTVMDISNFWTIQSALQLFLSALIGVPAGIGASMILFKLTSSASQVYPFVLNWMVILMAVGFIFLVLLATHLIAMFKIKKWNLADNTRSRE